MADKNLGSITKTLIALKHALALGAQWPGAMRRDLLEADLH
jgi:hypothetical protein